MHEGAAEHNRILKHGPTCVGGMKKGLTGCTRMYQDEAECNPCVKEGSEGYGAIQEDAGEDNSI